MQSMENAITTGGELESLKGVGKSTRARLEKLGIHSVADLLLHLPFRYQDRTRVVPVAQLVAGTEVVVQGTVLSATVQYGRRRSLLVTIGDDSGTMRLRFFHFSMSQKAALADGKRITAFGEVRQAGSRYNRFGPMEMVHPEYRCGDASFSFSENNSLTPVYPVTEGLQQRSIRSLVKQAFDYLDKHGDMLTDCLPQALLEQYGLDSLRAALVFIHYPPADVSLEQMRSGTHPSQQRLVFEELLARHLCLKQLRKRIYKKKAVSVTEQRRTLDRLNALLPFSLTQAQQRCIDEVLDDLVQSHPMQRLVQGDVGSGKTMVAVCSAFHVAVHGCQVAMMAPTELLAEQHYAGFSRYADAMGVEVCCLTGKTRAADRAVILENIRTGKTGIIVGTHALFQEGVEFRNLSYIIVDEQHRFGVMQRLNLLNKGQQQGIFPHQLIMSATPIPRSLAMSIYADLDCSIIDELPPGRSPVRSVVMAENKRDEVLERVQMACRQGRQAYWVCPLVEESEALQCQAAVETAQSIADALPQCRIGLVHGRMKAMDKERVMQQFKQGALDILVATTVIEVGIDVPNASLMVIENSERLGLSQLHQLRGRVGRGQQISSCIFMYSPPLSSLAHRRLSVMRETTDGFEIARQDMQMRGPGEVLGTQQTGLMQFRIADLPRDDYLLPRVKQAAEALLQDYPQATQSIINRWVGQSARYWEA